jgi:sporulation protein YlmC with PRC-barrel domain
MTMVFVSGIEGRELATADGVALGTITKVLFHPAEPRAIGYAVRPPNALAVVERPGTYLPLAAVTFGPEGAHCELTKLPVGGKAAQALGYDPDITVIWTGMPVAVRGDALIGTVSDVAFDEVTGTVSRVDVGGGTIADVAHGRYRVPGDAVEGYRDGAVRVTADIADLDGSGGFAKTAAEQAVAAARVAHAVGEAVVDASGATGRAIRAVTEADLAKRAAEKAKRTWRETRDAFREGMKDDE